MGRHSAGPAPESLPSPEPGPADGAPPEVAQPELAQPEVAQPELAQPEVASPEVPSPEVAQHRFLDRLALAAAAAAGTGAVMAWAGAQPTTYLLGAGGTVVAVLVAAQVAGSVPGPARSRTDRADGAVGREP